jgi:hypothetical protein
VNLSWESLDKTQENLQKEIDAHEEELASLMAKIIRKKRILRQARAKAKTKTLHLMEEMEASGEMDEDCPASSIGIGVSPAVWNSMGFINDLVGVDGAGDSTGFGLGDDPFSADPLFAGGTSGTVP